MIQVLDLLSLVAAPSGCCDRFIEMIYLHGGFMGQALLKKSERYRKQFRLLNKALISSYQTEDPTDISQSSISPID